MTSLIPNELPHLTSSSEHNAYDACPIDACIDVCSDAFYIAVVAIINGYSGLDTIMLLESLNK